MSRRNLLSIIVVLILGAMLVLAVAAGRRFPLINKVTATVLMPFENGINALLHGGDEAREFWRALTELRAQNKQLQKENQDLRKEHIDMVSLLKENEKLRALLNYKQVNPTKTVVAAKVVAKNFGDLRDTIYLDAGVAQGVAVDNAVITERGLVGVVDEAYEEYCRVLLISSTNCRIGARVVHTGFDGSGIIHGIYETENILAMEHIPREAQVAEGDLVVTNGYSGKHPENIPIGRVLSVQMDAAGLMKEVDVELSERIVGLERVLVVTDFAPKLQTIKKTGGQQK